VPNRNTALLERIVGSFGDLIPVPEQALARLEREFDDSLLIVAGEVQPHSTFELSAMTPADVQPVSMRIIPWTWRAAQQSEQRCSGFPRPIRDWLLRKYDPQRPEYRHEVRVLTPSSN